jgi:hypothetical protein
MLRRAGEANHEIAEYQQLNRAPQFGEIIELTIFQPLRARVTHVQASTEAGKSGEFVVYSEEDTSS